MNKVQIYWSSNPGAIQTSVNKLAEDYEIINVSFTSRTNAVGGEEYSVMVLYKVK